MRIARKGLTQRGPLQKFLERRKIDHFERMTLLPVPPLSVPLAVVETAERINAMLARPPGVNLLRTLEPEDAVIFQAVSRFAPLSKSEEFAKELLASPADCCLLARLFPGDGMARLVTETGGLV